MGMDGVMAQQFQKVLAQGQEQSKKDVAKVASLLESIKEVIKELQLANNNNSAWMMHTLQSICDKTGVVLDDPMEKEE